MLTHAKLREKQINNIYFDFNDLNLATELEENIKEKFSFTVTILVLYGLKFTSIDFPTRRKIKASEIPF